MHQKCTQFWNPTQDEINTKRAFTLTSSILPPNTKDIKFWFTLIFFLFWHRIHCRDLFSNFTIWSVFTFLQFSLLVFIHSLHLPLVFHICYRLFSSSHFNSSLLPLSRENFFVIHTSESCFIATLSLNLTPSFNFIRDLLPNFHF